MSYTLITSRTQAEQLANIITAQPHIGADTETEGFDPYQGRPRLLILRVADHTYLVDLFQTGHIWNPIVWALCDYKGVIVGQGLKFDAKWWLQHLGWSASNVYDTHRASRLIYNGKEGIGHNLYELYQRELGIAPPAEDLGASNWSGELSPEQLAYAAGDVEYILPLAGAFDEKIIALGLEKVMTLENNVVIAEACMELAGMPFDATAWEALATSNIERKARLSPHVFSLLPNINKQVTLFGEDIVGPAWNLDSPVQLKKALHMAGYDVPDTSENSLATLPGALGKALLEYREVTQGVKSFGLDYLENVHPKTGRIHASYWPHTGAGRYSCAKPNIQQTPHAKQYRECFKPAEGNCLVISDFSQLELRLCAQISGDRAMQDAYSKGKDLHTLTAIALTGRDDAEARRIAKSANFNLIFGGGAETLAIYAKTNYGVDITIDEAKGLIKRFFNVYRQVKGWHKKITHKSMQLIPARTIYGRIRYLPLDTQYVNEEGKVVTKSSYNKRINTPIQGSGADAIKVAMRLVWERLLKKYPQTRLCSTVHDEISVECPRTDAETVRERLHECMIEALQPMLPDVPAGADTKICAHWGDK